MQDYRRDKIQERSKKSCTHQKIFSVHKRMRVQSNNKKLPFQTKALQQYLLVLYSTLEWSGVFSQHRRNQLLHILSDFTIELEDTFWLSQYHKHDT